MNIDSASTGVARASNSASMSIGKPTFSNKFVAEALNVIDQRGGADQVSISSTSLFLFQLNIYANSLSVEKRNQFAKALEASGDPIFSQGFLDSVRYSMSYGGISIGSGEIISQAPCEDQCGVIAMYGGPIPYNGLRANYLDDYASMGKASLNNALEQILTDTTDDLSQQDRASIQSTLERAIYSSFNALKSDYDIFSTNYHFLIAQDVINGFDLGDETRSNLTNLLGDIKENNVRVNSSNLAEAIQDAQRFPGHASKILASAQKTREGIELNKLLQSHFQASDSNLLENQEYFTELMQGSSSIESSGMADYADMFDYYQRNEIQFKGTFIEQNWSAEIVPNNEQFIEGDIGEPEEVVSGFASKYIGAVNMYLSTLKAE